MKLTGQRPNETLNQRRSFSGGNPLGALVALPPVVWRRVLSHIGLLLAVWAGFALAVALVVNSGVR